MTAFWNATKYLDRSSSEYQARPRLDKEVTQHLTELRQTIHRMGEINLTAIDEYHEIKERYDFLTNQMDDLTRIGTVRKSHR